MKRSEAVELIKKTLNHQISLEEADKVLSELERVGMLPVGRIIEECDKHEYPNLTEDEFMEFCWKEEVHRWEDES